MNLSKSLGGLALGVSAAFAMTSAQAITIINADNPGGAAFTNFEWSDSGVAFTQGFDPTVANKPFTLTFFAVAGQLKNGASVVNSPNMDAASDGPTAGKTYEYTVIANLNETSNCVGNSCTFSLTSGTFDIYYDLTPDSNSSVGSLGTGFGDGIKILSGTLDPAAVSGTFTTDANGGFGFSTLTGEITDQNLSYIQPALGETSAVTTLQLGFFALGWTNPGGFNGVAYPFTTQFDLALKADSNQNFIPAAIPEPAMLGLLGVGLVGIGAFRRKSE